MPLQALRRFGRRVLAHFRSHQARFVYSGRYVIDIPGVPMDPRRGENILTFLAREGLVRPGDLRWPRLASMASLCRVHSPDYLEALARPGSLLGVLGLSISDAEESHFLSVQRAMVGGTVLAARMALATGLPAMNLGGGLHHAHRDSGRGFCAFNDVAVAVAEIRERGFEGPVLIIDLDLHDGDGTRSLFASDATVHTYSVHNKSWDDREALASTCIALGDDVEDELYLDTVRATLPLVLRHTRPGFVFYLAGCDPAADDRLGNWRITAEGMLERDRFVVEEVRRQRGDVPIVAVLAGGYGNRSWRYTARFLSWALTSGREVIEPPSTEDLTLARYRYHASFLRPADLTTEPDDTDFGLSEADLMPGHGPGPGDTRFLGYYSLHGLEIALERFGLLARLRSMGYSHPTLELELDNPTGQTLRVFGSGGEDELLLEIRARRDRRIVPDREMLFVEWLLLQHPRGVFSDHRPPLPGQKRPGLGLLRDVMALLVLVCERLGLAGIAFVPSHFHLAAQSDRYLRFLDPKAQARFLALSELFRSRGVSLARATRAVADGEVRNRATGEVFPWQPAPMVMPVAEDLAQEVSSEEYKAAVEAARKELDLEWTAAPAAG